jgi:hypothetical protein
VEAVSQISVADRGAKQRRGSREQSARSQLSLDTDNVSRSHRRELRSGMA